MSVHVLLHTCLNSYTSAYKYIQIYMCTYVCTYIHGESCILNTHMQTDTDIWLQTSMHAHITLVHFCPEMYIILELNVSRIFRFA